ncbi:MAG TPA: tautomerase family protein [Eubacteriales bacterium]|nr:tautomerase family protein [Clostridia bacterium]HRR90089.1 tautomerase family protein [Eubacteriales bacterium]HRU84943.1 tautomerase family protein [Eubacteriales bacterium]
MNNRRKKMPHISLKMLKGRSEEQKRRAAEALTEALKASLGVSEQHISVTVEDYTAEEWQDVFKEEITDKTDKLYLRPRYDPKDLL